MFVRGKEDQEFLRRLGARIAFIRKSKGMTQIKLGELCDLDRQNMYRLEKGNTNPSIVLLKQICGSLGITFGELLDSIV